MSCWYFVSDLHGSTHRYQALARLLSSDPPDVLCIGGDILPGGSVDFVDAYLLPLFRRLHSQLGECYPATYLIMGNDDPRKGEANLLQGEAEQLWHYAHQHRFQQDGYQLAGYSCVPPTPFLLKDWERYDVSRYVDVGCIPPEAGNHTVPLDAEALQWHTIARDIAELTAEMQMQRSIMLFHSPPYQSKLDRAALDGQMVDHVPVDVHVGSIAIQRFIAARQPHITLHGHVHESARLTGAWMQVFGATTAFSAAHDGPQLAVISFDPATPAEATRLLL
jgi:Icc-related predicted phosphoesterase